MDITGKISDVTQFLKVDIWRIRMEDLHGPRRFFIRYLRISIIASKEYIKDNCTLWASSLTFFSLLSIVPIFAMAFAVAKGFGIQQHLEKLIKEQFVGQEEVTSRLLTYSHNLLENTKGEILAGVGAIFLIWAVFQILQTIESAFNNIWEIKRSRTIGRKLSDYLSLMLIGPVLLIISSSAMVLVAGEVNNILEKIGVLAVISPIITLIIKIVPYILIWILLTFMYVFIPNTKVKLSSGILGGIIAGTIFVILQWIYITFQIGVSRYNAIYGSFAALPLFLIWLNLSWLIVLFGAELTDSHQNEESYLFGAETKKISHSFRKLLSLQIIHSLIMNFKDGGKPFTANRLSKNLEIPPGTVCEILRALSECGLIIAVQKDNRDGTGYHPSRDIDAFTISYVIDALENAGIDTIPVAKTESLERISKSLKAFRGLVEKSDANVRLKDI